MKLIEFCARLQPDLREATKLRLVRGTTNFSYSPDFKRNQS